MTETYEPIETVELVGGKPALDFVNTGSQRRFGPFRERLKVYGDLLTLVERVGVMDRADLAELRKAWPRAPRAAERVLERARELRESLYRLFSRNPSNEATRAADLARVSRELSEACARRVLEESNGEVRYAWPRPLPLEGILWPLVLSGAELLTGSDVVRVKECGGDNCNWLFYDVSRNRSRRWCEMKDCGNRAKARRYHARHRARRGGAARAVGGGGGGAGS